MSTTLRSIINKYVVQKLGIDKAISFTLWTQILGTVRSLVAIILVSKYLTATEQGFYYTFTSILAIQIFFELGFSSIITQYAAHEKAHLVWSNSLLEGNNVNLSRLKSLLRLTIKWFSVMSVILYITLLIGGYLFFFYFSPKQEDVDWQIPWLLMATTTSIGLFISPVIAFYEGLGKVENIAKLRLYILLVSTICFFVALLLHAKLYAYAINNFVGLIVNLVWLLSFSVRKTLLSILNFHVEDYTISWRKEIFPYQWKIALSWMSGYFLFQLFNPILFSTVGARAAGQMGMTQSIVGGILALSNSWFSTKIPIFSNLIALKQYKQLDFLFNKTTKQSLAVILMCLCVLFATFGLISFLKLPITNRFLNIVPFIIIGICSIILLLMNALAIYLRCHKEEPFLLLSIISGLINAVLMFFTSKYLGITGMVSGYFGVILIALIIGYYIFKDKKRIWHGE